MWCHFHNKISHSLNLSDSRILKFITTIICSDQACASLFQGGGLFLKELSFKIKSLNSVHAVTQKFNNKFKPAHLELSVLQLRWNINMSTSLVFKISPYGTCFKSNFLIPKIDSLTTSSIHDWGNNNRCSH